MKSIRKLLKKIGKRIMAEIDDLKAAVAQNDQDIADLQAAVAKENADVDKGIAQLEAQVAANPSLQPIIDQLKTAHGNIRTAVDAIGKEDTAAAAITTPAIGPSSTTVVVGQTTTLIIKNSSNLPDGNTTTWQSDHPEFATVDTSGNVTGVAAGIAVITATFSDGTSSTCTVTVQ